MIGKRNSRRGRGHNEQILDEAAEWFVDVREGDIDASARQEFVSWLQRSPDHIKAYLEVAAFWGDLPQLADKDDVDVDALIAYAQSGDNVVPLEGGSVAIAPQGDAAALLAPPVRRTSFARRSLAIAAAISLLAVGLCGGWWLWGERGQTYVTAIGEQRSVTLRDGSTIDMNARSRIRIRFSQHARDIDLIEGQAMFTVARDPQRPFIVSSASTRVRAVGTQFVVYRRKSGTTVTVLEGKVSVVDAKTQPEAVSKSEPVPPEVSKRERGGRGTEGPVFLEAGEQLLMTSNSMALPKPADLASATAWTQRQIVFQGTPLSEVVEEFNRYNLRQMVILDRDLESVRVSGIFSSTQSASLLRFLREQVGLVVDELDDTVEISRH